MLIEPAPQEPADDRAGANFPLSSATASIARRALAALVDGVVLGAALAAFGAIVLRFNPSLKPSLNFSLNPVRGPLPMLAGPTSAAAFAWSHSCSGRFTNSCLWCTRARLPDCALRGCGWQGLTAHRSIVAHAAGACWRRFSPRFPLGSDISGAFLTRMDCAGTTASPAPTSGRKVSQNNGGESRASPPRLNRTKRPSLHGTSLN